MTYFHGFLFLKRLIWDTYAYFHISIAFKTLHLEVSIYQFYESSYVALLMFEYEYNVLY